MELVSNMHKLKMETMNVTLAFCVFDFHANA